ncbi:crotonobetainyl-CoA:carnitine CoA-transferase CaiB-like acyl-CoA transferase [Xanthobacter flavus]|uniref:CoA transferase n=1 Tax=Xanthobacter flavus TaxID=281 RepID=A0A9W6CTI6_XANFL|nr:CaiB/BaiF CoA-transferase family protein [Xanthobacter flavus]MDR6336514.1 crotonobetainyl-CoA:carnitine CoA-transferase CaiB-like acyl-CoA transferase [Xanthobacter flavus]GLI25089.1 CoA transferase [Xanthobacter flavus]
MIREKHLPLAGIRALDFGHTVMGPSCAMILADLGADVLKIEPAPGGDPTRQLQGFGMGYFGYFNRNKRSLAVDLKSDAGREIARRLIKGADVLVENFAPGTMGRLGLDAETATTLNPRLVYASLKGFLDGPYAHRLALDEVVQMMSGLAYMTGPSGRPLRAGTSVVDIAGGMFAVIAILAALREREATGEGQVVEAALFETTVFLMGQHLAYAAQTNEPIPPMPERVSAWAVYEPFTLRDGRQIFVGITTDGHWQRFCALVGWQDMLADASLATNNGRVAARGRILPCFACLFGSLTQDEAVALCEKARIPFAPIARPEDLFHDPHLAATGGLMPTRLPNGVETRLPRLPIHMGEADLSLRSDPPDVGADTADVLEALGYAPDTIAALAREGVVAMGTAASR